MSRKNTDILQMVLIYLVIGLSGYLALKLSPWSSESMSLIMADVVMTVVCFIFSVLKKNTSVYDAFWSVIPFYFVVYLVAWYPDALTLGRIGALSVVAIWSWRLSLNWARSWPGFHHEDWRYVDLSKEHGKLYPLVNFFGLHLMPTLMVLAGLCPLYFIFKSDLHSVSLLTFGLFVSFIGVLLEFFADNQLAKFRENKPAKSELLDTGLWARSRNPNYLGEIMFWIGLAIIGNAYQAPFYASVGAILMFFLIVFVSIPMKEERMMERRPQYAAYKKSVPKLLLKLF